ncbi:MAG: rod shape-determining protein MreD [Bacteroidota bacterium]|nr:rod shape-determining protein MreD [Bacteroidota bacterium]
MINSILKFGAIAIILILLQILLFNNIQFSGYVNPYVYVMIILLLPAVTPPWLILVVAFLTGLVVDLFSGSPGMHSSATVLAGFSRQYVLRIIAPRDGYESSSDLSMKAYGVRWFFIYTTVIVLIHHTALFYLEVFRLSQFFRTFLRVLLSSAFTIGFIMLIERYRKRR